MDEAARKWRDKHRRCHNCAYLKHTGSFWYRECDITGNIIHLDDIYRYFFHPGMFCRYYKTKVEDDLNG